VSLDDESPTQYFGPNAIQWMHPNGKVLSLSPDQYNRALEQERNLTQEQRWAYEQERLGNPFDMAAIEDILTEANKKHHPGCASSRGRDCNCDYLKQWSQP
jgi:hypothetical protein